MKLPAFARWLLAHILPHDDRCVILADLDDEFARMIQPSRAPLAARVWYWRQVLASLPGAVSMRARFHWRDLERDLRHGGRLLRRSPAFASAAILTLTLGIGATSAVLTLANAVLVRPLPYREPDRIVSVMEIDRQRDAVSGNVSWPDFNDYARANQTLAAMAAYTGGSRTLTAPGAAAERLSVAMVTGRFFEVLGVSAAVGRALVEDDIPESAPAVMMITNAAWRTRFGSDPSVIGRVVILNGVSTAIVGVLPAGFEFPPRGQVDLWLPVHPNRNQIERKFYHWLDAVGRLRPGVTIDQANADLNRIAEGFAAVDPRAHQHTGVLTPLLQQRIVGDVRPTMLLLSAASLLVLLVACANIAGLLLAQSASRTTEMSVRNALGAGRSRLLRQLLAENIVLAAAGGILGIAAGQWMIRGLLAAMPPAQRLTLPHIATLSLDTQSVLISVVLTITALLLFGLIPSWRSVRAERLQATRGVAGAGSRELRLQSVFVVVQVALALVLLVGAGLLAQSLRRLLDVSPGFRTDHLLTMTVALPAATSQNVDALRAVHTDLTARMASLPGVLGATIINQLPLSGPSNSGGFRVVGDVTARETITLVRSAAANYFDVMGIRLEAGRTFAPADLPSSPQVVIVNRALADLALGGRLAGQRLVFPFMPNQELEVVGIVGNEQFDALDTAIGPALYFPETQGPDSNFSLLLRTAGDPSAMIAPVAAEVARLDPGITLSQRTTMENIVAASPAVFRRRSVLTLIGGFAATALVLAAIGLYGVLSQLVAQRTREIGVRLALGAGRADIGRAVILRGLMPVGIGLVVGLAGSLLVGRSLGSLLYGTSATDVATLGVVVAALAAAALIACIVPTRRALRVNPVDALRGD